MNYLGRARGVASAVVLLSVTQGFGIYALPDRLGLASEADSLSTPPIEQIQAAMPPQTDTGWILEYLVFTMNDEEQAARARFETVFALTQTEKGALRAVAARRSDGERAARGRATAAVASALNAEAEQGLRLLAGSRYEAMLVWLREWYADNMAVRTQQQINLVNTQKRAMQRPSPLARLLGAHAAKNNGSMAGSPVC